VELFSEATRAAAKKAIEAVEARTSAEVVVALLHASDRYREADYLWGFVLAEIVLALLLFLPQTFVDEVMPVDVLLGFALGAFISAHVPALRALLVFPRRKRERALAAARATFVELGISRTRRRNGVLVYVTHLERRVVVVGDTGIDAVGMGPRWTAAVAALESARSVEEILKGIEGLAEPLAAIHPHTSDDVNELPDEVGVA
jgi:uncharacterized membrane protein